jgi:hypothetical protein
MQNTLLLPKEQYATGTLQISPVDASRKQSNYRIAELASSIRSKMMVGLTVAPTITCSAYAENTEKLDNLQYILLTVDKAVHPKIDIQNQLPTLYLEGGVMCCDTHRNEPTVDYANAIKTNNVAMELLQGTQPLGGVAYAHLDGLVRKNAKKQSSIAGML